MLVLQAFLLCIYFITISVITPVVPIEDGFVYLKDINPSIISNLRYFSEENVMGRRILGYHANEVILTKQAAQALSNAQEEFKKDEYTLVIYDAYRPQKAVNSILEWSKNPDDDVQKNKYYPRVDKKDFFDLGYFARRSGHSRGSTVDLTIMKLSSSLNGSEWSLRKLLDDQEIMFYDDGTVDMGSSYDLLDEASFHNSSLIPEENVQKRNYLKDVMKKHGFKEYSKEWWHYTLINEPFPTSYFDFDVKKKFEMPGTCRK